MNDLRLARYEATRGLFLVHTWKRSSDPQQVADVTIQLCQHGDGPLGNGTVQAVEYTLGPKFTDHSLVRTDPTEGFQLTVSMWGPMLCVANVHFSDGAPPLLLERYINIDL